MDSKVKLSQQVNTDTYVLHNQPSEIQEVSSYQEDDLNQQLKPPMFPAGEHNMSKSFEEEAIDDFEGSIAP